MRIKITTYLGSGEMTKNELLQVLNTNVENFDDFMNKEGARNGADDRVYTDAMRFFLDKESQGSKPAFLKLKRNANDDSIGNYGKKMRFDDIIHSICGIEIGENICIFDEIDEVREKSRNVMEEYGIPMHAWCTALGNVGVDEWKRFMQGRGQTTICSGNKCYKSAYILLEKIRLFQNQPKSVERLKREMETREGFAQI
jgi:hypothetical protein